MQVNKAAVLIMDYQYKQLFSLPESLRNQVLEKAVNVLDCARSNNIPVIYVEVLDHQGPPEFRPWDTIRRKNSGRTILGEREKEREIYFEITPQARDIVVTKRRFGPFSTTNLDEILEKQRIVTLILLGISTGGVVLSTVRWAADIDYELIVLADCCADYDEEVHRVLIEKVIPRQAEVINSADFIKALG